MNCPSCKTNLDNQAQLAHEPDKSLVPNPGDINICIYCGNITEFTDCGEAVIISNEKLQKIKNNKEIWDQIVFVRTVIQEAKKKYTGTNYQKIVLKILSLGNSFESVYKKLQGETS